MVKRILAFLISFSLLLCVFPANAAKSGKKARTATVSFNPALLDWRDPAFSYTTKGKNKPEKGYQLPSDKMGQVLKVKTVAGGWTQLVTDDDGDFSFTVDTDQMKTDSFNLVVWRYRDVDGDRNLKQTDVLHYESEEGLTTCVIHDVYAGETLYWYEDKDSVKGGHLVSTYLLMVCPGDCTQEKQEVTWELEDQAFRAVASDDGLNGQPVIRETPKAGDKFVMGWYEQDNNLNNGRERIEWTVLEVNKKKDQVLVISSLALDCVLYHPSRSVVSWQNSSIRNWLNFDFEMTALSSAERACIIPQKIAGGTDDVTMLDAKQVNKYKLAKSGCLVSEYAAHKDKPVNVAENGRGCWWVRENKTRSGGWTSFVGRHGKVYKTNYTTSADNGVRPAMLLSLSALKNCRLGPDFTVMIGEVVDASNPTQKLSGAKVTINGSAMITDARGRFALEVTSGEHAYQAAKSGYISAEGSFRVQAGSQSVYTIPLCKKMEKNEYRVVLTWGLNPVDLDSHLSGETENGSDYHVFYHQLKADGGKALLEWDDVDSYGPETTHFFTYSGRSYTFSIHDYTNRASSNSGKMASSGARVVVYHADSEIASFDVPDEPGTVWNVFRVENGTLTPINRMTYCEDPRGVR